MPRKFLFIICLTISLFHCGKPVPEDKMDYVGRWQGENMTLVITKDGGVEYERFVEGITKSLRGPLRGFKEDNFVAGVSVIKKEFIVQKPPYQKDGLWRMTVDGVDLIKLGTSRQIPDQKKLVNMTKQAMTVFARSIKKKNFTGFYNFVSKLWQAQTNPKQLQSYFQVFIDKKIDLTPLSLIDPVFSKEPGFNENGFLVLEGYYPGQTVTYFTIKYIYEHPEWKVVGIYVKL
ncbi:MAG: hypothetical protein JW827_06960 [Spirochaetes bacterium]|nr:hypothetical protein [Spirochaetota bacterium]